MGAALALCLGAYFAVSSAGKRAEGDLDDDIAALIYADGRQSPSYISFGSSDGDTLEFNRGQDGLWRYVSEPEFPLSQVYVTRIASALDTMRPTHVIAGELPLSDFGLNSPSRVLSASDGDGASFDLLLGDRFSDGVYAMERVGDAVYALNAAIADYLDVSLYDMAVAESIPRVPSDNVISLRLAGADGEVAMERRLISGKYVWVIPADGVRVDGLPDDGSGRLPIRRLEMAISALASPVFTRCVDWRPDAGSLGAYGLDRDSALVVEIGYVEASGMFAETTSYTALIGGATPDGADMYAALDGSEFVRALSADVCAPLLALYDALPKTPRSR
jgi:hypothetical protein